MHNIWHEEYKRMDYKPDLTTMNQFKQYCYYIKIIKKNNWKFHREIPKLCEECLKKKLTGDKQKNIEECEICKKEDLSMFGHRLKVSILDREKSEKEYKECI